MKNIKIIGFILIISLTLGLFPASIARAAASEIEVIEVSDSVKYLKIFSIPDKKGAFGEDIKISDQVTTVFSVPEIPGKLEQQLKAAGFGYFMNFSKVVSSKTEVHYEANLFIYDKNAVDDDILVYARSDFFRLDTARVAEVSASSDGAHPDGGLYVISSSGIDDCFYSSNGDRIAGSFSQAEFMLDDNSISDLLSTIEEYRAYKADKDAILGNASSYCDAEGIALNFEKYAKEQCGIKAVYTTFKRGADGEYTTKRYFLRDDIVVVLASMTSRCACYAFSVKNIDDDPEQVSGIQALDTKENRVILYNGTVGYSSSMGPEEFNYYQVIMDTGSRLTINWDCFKEFEKLIK